MKKVLVAFILCILVLCLHVSAGNMANEFIEITLPTVDYQISNGSKSGTSDIELEGFGITTDLGAPKLPARIFPIALPPGCRFHSLEILSGEELIINDTINIEPRQTSKPITDTESEPIRKHQNDFALNYKYYYSQGAVYPAELATVIGSSSWRKYNLIDIRITPFRYYTTENTLSFYPKLRVLVHYEKVPSQRGTGYQPISDYSLEFEQTASRVIYNYDQAQKWYPISTPGKGLHEFVVITTTDLITAIQPLIDIEEAKGRSTYIATVDWINSNYSGRDLAEKMRSFLRDKYPTSQWGITDVCLVGHHNDVPMRTVSQDLGYGTPRTDFYFAELSAPDNTNWDSNNNNQWWDSSDNADFYAEVNVGRIPWSTWNTVNDICIKSQAFELTNDPLFKQSILFLGGFFWEDTDNAVLMEAIADQSWMSSWNMHRLYEQNSTVYSNFPCDEELTHSNVRSAWPGGTYCFVDWAGHGSPTSAHIMGYGSQAFIDTSDCSLLDDNYPSIIFADACSNSDTDSTNIGAKMLQQGAVGFVGATKVALGSPGWNNPNDGSSQSLDYFFTTGVTSTNFSQGAALRQGILDNYLNGGWDDDKYEIAEWSLWGNPDLGLELAIGSDGVVSMDQPVYGPTMDVIITLRDIDLNINATGIDTATVTIQTSVGNDIETLTMQETGPNTSVFSCVCNLSPSAPAPGNSILEISNGELVTTIYIDANDGHGGVNIEKTVTAIADTVAPTIGNVAITELTYNSMVIEWDTSEPADSTVYYGAGTPDDSKTDVNLGNHHVVIIDTLSPCTEFSFYVESTDRAGNVSSDDNGGSYYVGKTWELTVIMSADMNTDPGWTTAGDWEFGSPSGGGGQHGNPDPTSGHTGENVYGYNLDGDYPNNLSERDLITGAIDCSDAHGTVLGFWRWLGVERNNYDHVYIRISTDGSNWELVWENQDVDITDDSWIYQEFDISSFADGNSTVYIKWVMGSTDGGWQYCGWNIDDVQVVTSQPCDPNDTPTPTPLATWTPVPTNTPVATNTPFPSYTPTQVPTDTPQATFTPTATAEPTELTMTLQLSQQVFRANDRFHLECICYNPGYDALVDRYILLEVYGAIYFWPDWGQAINFDSCNIVQNSVDTDTILDFTWPTGVAGNAEDLNFWGGLMWPGTSILAAEITHVSFGYE